MARLKLDELAGGAWKTEAKQSIKEYLSNELSDLIEKGKIIILA